MKNIEQKIIRFYADKPEHVKAFDILKRVAVDKDSSIQEFVIAAINHYGDMKLNENALAETEENMQQPLMGTDGNKEFEEGAFIERVVGAVEAVMEEKLSLMLTSYIQVAVAEQIEKSLQAANSVTVTAGNVNGVAATNTETTNVADENESMSNAGNQDEDVVEKDVVANDMLDLDSFFS